MDPRSEISRIDSEGNLPAKIDISIIVPILNEASNLVQLRDEVEKAFAGLSMTYELIFVNDGSADQSQEILAGFAAADHRVIVIQFWRNFGQTAALSAGIEMARGRIIVPMDGDLQNDPADISNLIAKLEEGYDLVSGWRRDRHDSFDRILASRVANRLISFIGGVPLHDLGCTLKAYRREIIKGVRLYGDMQLFIAVYAAWQGGRVTELVVRHRPRVHGKSHYGMERTFKVILDLMVVRFLLGYLSKPIHVFGGCGLLCMAMSVVSTTAAIILKIIPASSRWGPIFHRNFTLTPLPIISVALFVVGVQLILMGLLAELQMRTYYESQNLKPYRIKEIINNPAAPTPSAV
jgi:dolichol-phosphate mannosyltransferase